MLRQRVITAVLLLPIVLAVVILAPAWLFDVVVAGVLLLLALEYFALCHANPLARAVPVAATLVLYAAAVMPWQLRAHVADGVLPAAIVLWALAFLWLFVRTRLPGVVKSLAGVALLAGAGVALHGLKLLDQDGRWVMLALLIVWAADVGAYAAGRTFGRHKLAPAISPGKTWEGFAGGVAVVMMVAVASAYWLLPAAQHAAWYVLMFGAAIVSVAGDLFESLLKRQAGVKDSGALLPGHGGMLDRLDSLLAVAPVFLFFGMEYGVFGELAMTSR